MDKHTVCIDCGGNKVSTFISQSLQCNKCQDKLFDRLRSIAGRCKVKGNKKQTIDKVRELFYKGFNGRQIAEKLEMDDSGIYRYIQKIKLENDYKKHKIHDHLNIKERG